MSSTFANVNNFMTFLMGVIHYGCGKLVNGVAMSCNSWHKIFYIAVHIGFLDLRTF